MTLGGRTFMILNVDQRDGAYTGRITTPAKFGMSMGQGLRISNIEMPVRDRSMARAAIQGQSLRLTFDDPANPNEPDQFDMTLQGADRALLALPGHRRISGVCASAREGAPASHTRAPATTMTAA